LWIAKDTPLSLRCELSGRNSIWRHQLVLSADAAPVSIGIVHYASEINTLLSNSADDSTDWHHNLNGVLRRPLKITHFLLVSMIFTYSKFVHRWQP
jgi:hypothetical protein